MSNEIHNSPFNLVINDEGDKMMDNMDTEWNMICTDGSMDKKGVNKGIGKCKIGGKAEGRRAEIHGGIMGTEMEAIELGLSEYMEKGNNLIISDCLSALNFIKQKEWSWKMRVRREEVPTGMRIIERIKELEAEGIHVELIWFPGHIKERYWKRMKGNSAKQLEKIRHRFGKEGMEKIVEGNDIVDK